MKCQWNSMAAWLTVTGLLVGLGLMSLRVGAAPAVVPAGLLERLDATRFGPSVLVEALVALDDNRPPQAFDRALPLLLHPDPWVSRTAAWFLRRLERGADAWGPARDCALDKGQELARRVSATLALGELREAGAIADLESLLTSSEDLHLRSAAAHSLGLMARPGCSATLAQTLGSAAEPEVRIAAAIALAEVPDAEAENLLPGLNDSDEGVRLTAVWSLGRIRASTTTGRLLGILQSDTSCRVRSAAAWSLSQMGDVSLLPALQTVRDASDCRLAAQAAGLAVLALSSAANP